MPRQRKPKPPPTAYSRVVGDNWQQKLAFIRGRLEQEATCPTDMAALFEYIDLLHVYLDKMMDDATAGTGGWRQYALGDRP